MEIWKTLLTFQVQRPSSSFFQAEAHQGLKTMQIYPSHGKKGSSLGIYHVLREKPFFVSLKSLFSSSFLWNGYRCWAAFSILNSRVKNSAMLSQVHFPTIAFSLCLSHVADVLRFGKSSNLPWCISSTPTTQIQCQSWGWKKPEILWFWLLAYLSQALKLFFDRWK